MGDIGDFATAKPFLWVAFQILIDWKEEQVINWKSDHVERYVCRKFGIKKRLLFRWWLAKTVLTGLMRSKSVFNTSEIRGRLGLRLASMYRFISPCTVYGLVISKYFLVGYPHVLACLKRAINWWWGLFCYFDWYVQGNEWFYSSKYCRLSYHSIIRVFCLSLAMF